MSSAGYAIQLVLFIVCDVKSQTHPVKGNIKSPVVAVCPKENWATPPSPGTLSPLLAVLWDALFRALSGHGLNQEHSVGLPALLSVLQPAGSRELGHIHPHSGYIRRNLEQNPGRAHCEAQMKGNYFSSFGDLVCFNLKRLKAFTRIYRKYLILLHFSYKNDSVLFTSARWD